MNYSEKIAYLKGLAEGSGIDAGDKSGRIILGIIDALADMADTLKSLENAADNLETEVEAISEGLEELSAMFEDGDEGLEAKCPACGHIFEIDVMSIEDGIIECPECGERLELDLGCDDDCDCCGGIAHIHGGPADEDDE